MSDNYKEVTDWAKYNGLGVLGSISNGITSVYVRERLAIYLIGNDHAEFMHTLIEETYKAGLRDGAEKYRKNLNNMLSDYRLGLDI
jgi:DNA-binding ferritin-like protein (Dps family)